MKEAWSILLVDDEPDICNALRRSLLVPGYEILIANSAVKALEILSEQHVDAIISDYNMPGMDGLDLLQHVRIMQPQVLRILLTARGDLPLAVRALNEGGVHRFLLKPWNHVDLRGTLELALHSMNTRPIVAVPAPMVASND